METKKPHTFILTLMCVFALNAHAAEIRGTRSCGQWIAGKSNGQSYANEAWFVGFLSGMVFQSNKDLLKGTDNPSIYLWVDIFCQKNPLKELTDAADELATELAKKRGISR